MGGRTALALLGPTASGKSRLALQLADELPIEIVSVDSGQVYRGMDIGTAKPTPAERARVPHHLIDLVDPTEAYSAGRFRDDAIAAVEGVLGRGRIPFLVGGTMLYYRALAHGLDALPGADSMLRAEIVAAGEAKGWQAMHAELARVDPVTASRLAPNDAQRIERALEVYRVTGKPLSALQTAARALLPFRLLSFALVPEDRAALHAHIAERFDTMLKEGLVEEVQALRRRYPLHAGLPSMRCVGYRQVWGHLDGAYDRAVLREKGSAATRQLAKRQLTWLRSLPDVELFGDAGRLAARLRACAAASQTTA
ncbi:MAG: tRNA (adenosine(37)-N6)-dimethylallyltransferase MiaA [Burkholderiales bacterium]